MSTSQRRRTDAVQVSPPSAAVLIQELERKRAITQTFAHKPVLLDRTPSVLLGTRHGDLRATNFCYSIGDDERIVTEPRDFPTPVYFPERRFTLSLDDDSSDDLVLGVNALYESHVHMFEPDAVPSIGLLAAARTPVTEARYERLEDLLERIIEEREPPHYPFTFEERIDGAIQLSLVLDLTLYGQAILARRAGGLEFLLIEGKEKEFLDEVIANAKRVVSFFKKGRLEIRKMEELLHLLALMPIETEF
ncbi:hypothetical protein HZC07_00490 [Candidatus Micrarchaeota archaeon]|nr:hypothetical protein [Candidatus Micrarchaeota archaeon]